MIKTALAAVAVGIVGYLIARWRYRCDHKWDDRGWSDKKWDLKSIHGDGVSGRPPQHHIKRGRQQVCVRCGTERVKMERIKTWKYTGSDGVHNKLASGKSAEIASDTTAEDMLGGLE